MNVCFSSLLGVQSTQSRLRQDIGCESVVTIRIRHCNRNHIFVCMSAAKVKSGHPEMKRLTLKILKRAIKPVFVSMWIVAVCSSLCVCKPAMYRKLPTPKTFSNGFLSLSFSLFYKATRLLKPSFLFHRTRFLSNISVLSFFNTVQKIHIFARKLHILSLKNKYLRKVLRSG